MPFTQDDLRQIDDVVLGQSQCFDLGQTSFHLHVWNHLT